MNISLKKRLIFVILLTVSIIYAISHWHKTPSSLWGLLDHYGFLDQQKPALEHLCHESQILSHGQSFNQRFPKTKDQDELLKDIIDFAKLTQTHFSLRSGTAERWEVKPSEWMVPTEKMLQSLRTLGVVEDFSPKNKEPDVICVLGATFETMGIRVGYVEKLTSQGVFTDNVVLLAGERKAAIGVDGSQKDLAQIAFRRGLSIDQLTETHLIEEAFKASSLASKFVPHIIDTKAGHLPRPTTETTTREFISWLRLHPQIKSVLFISNQPFVNYQKAVISEVFKSEKCAIPFEVVGAKASEPLNIQSLVESLGSYIWAQTPEVIRQAGLKINASNREELKSLYGNNPLIYQGMFGSQLPTSPTNR